LIDIGLTIWHNEAIHWCTQIYLHPNRFGDSVLTNTPRVQTVDLWVY